MFTGYQKVKLTKDLLQKKLSKGAIGTIVKIERKSEK